MSRDHFVLRFGVPALAAGLLGFTAWSVSANYRPRVVSEPVFPAPVSPFGSSLDAPGIVEPASEAIAIGIERGGVVSQIDVQAGARVSAGQTLFGIDDREYRATVAQQEAAVAAAEAALHAASSSLVLQRSVIEQAAARLTSAQAEDGRAALDRDRYGTLAHDDWASRQRFEAARADAGKAAAATEAAAAALTGAEEQTQILLAQHAEASARLALAKASLDQARVALDKTSTRAPIDGAVLKVNIRRGEYAQAGALAEPLLVMGRVDPLHVRADIDEADSGRACPDSPALARLRGNPAISVPLRFVRFEPMVTPKRSLTDESAERVDTRVLQVIYEFAPSAFPALVGQQVDVFIETAPDTQHGCRRGRVVSVR